MSFKLRPARPQDAEEAGRICYEAFRGIADEHAFPHDVPSLEFGIGLARQLLDRKDVYAVAAERSGRLIGSIFLWEMSAVSGIGPITVDPDVQNGGAGRAMMEVALCRAREQGAAGVRLVQAAYHSRSLSLYAKVGFDIVEPLATMQGPALNRTILGHAVRAATLEDVASCDALAARVHGFARSTELRDAIGQGTARVVTHDGRISGYATSVGYFGHATCESNQDLKALIAAAPDFPGVGFLLPIRNGDVYRWCLQHGLRVMEPMTLMSLGLYNPPAGAFLPSIIF